jgi:hypothetical protein
MNALAPPKRRAPGREIAGAAKLRLLATYRVAAVFATTFGWPFWFAEQWRGRLQDRIENGGNNR